MSHVEECKARKTEIHREPRAQVADDINKMVGHDSSLSDRNVTKRLTRWTFRLAFFASAYSMVIAVSYTIAPALVSRSTGVFLDAMWAL